MRHEPTDAERVLWQHLRHLDVARLSLPSSGDDRPILRGLRLSRSSRLVIELDGGQHNEAAGLARDAKRTADLEARGYRVLRFWNNDVLGNVEGVMETIAAAVRDAGPPPPTPPRHASHGGGEQSTVPARKRVSERDDPPLRPRRGGAFVVFGIVVFALSGDLPFGRLSAPGAGMMPKLLIVLMIAVRRRADRRRGARASRSRRSTGATATTRCWS